MQRVVCVLGTPPPIIKCTLTLWYFTFFPVPGKYKIEPNKHQGVLEDMNRFFCLRTTGQDLLCKEWIQSSLLSFYAISLLSISIPICSFSMQFVLFPYYFFPLCVIWMFLHTFVCFLMCLCLSCVNLICLTKVAAFVAALSASSKRELLASQPNTSTKTE